MCHGDLPGSAGKLPWKLVQSFWTLDLSCGKLKNKSFGPSLFSISLTVITNFLFNLRNGPILCSNEGPFATDYLKKNIEIGLQTKKY